MGQTCDTLFEKRQYYNEVAQRITNNVQSLLLGKDTRWLASGAFFTPDSKKRETLASAVFHLKCD
jgi:hypothetical protein